MRTDRQEGSIMLEAAVILPAILLLAAFFLAQIRSVRYEMLVTYALEQTAEEAALLIPLGDALLQGVGLTEIATELRDMLPADALTDQLLTMAADVSTSLLFGRFVHSRLDFWLDEATASTGFRLPPFEKQLAMFWQPDGNALLLSLRFDVRTAFFERPVLTKSLVPLWTAGYAVREGTSEEIEENAYDPIWSMSNFDRGAAFREKYGANLPFSYPVIAAIHGDQAMSIKSMDLTAPTYVSGDTTMMQISQHAQVLSAFDGMKWGEHTILPGQIKSRKLLLIIPENSPAYANPAYFEKVAQRLRLNGVTLEVVRHGQSGRYADLKEPGN